jgi:hypothetical protein
MNMFHIFANVNEDETAGDFIKQIEQGSLYNLSEATTPSFKIFVYVCPVPP